jgi:preprotein translocase subunit SecG
MTFPMITNILTIIQIVLAIILIIAVLLQARGSGLGAVFGGGGEVYRTKRGLEKGLFTGTIVVSILFFAAAFANVLF